LLLYIRMQTFGPQLKSITECTNCNEKLEFEANTTELLETANDEQKEYDNNWKFNGYEIRFRLLNSQDLAAIAHCNDISSARKILIQRCIQKISQRDNEVKIENLPNNVIEALAEEITKNDSLSLLQYNINCPLCGHALQMTFDIVSFFWDEISAYTKRLLLEIHMLATTYGWTESEILTLSPSRRQLYLEMVT